LICRFKGALLERFWPQEATLDPAKCDATGPFLTRGGRDHAGAMRGSV